MGILDWYAQKREGVHQSQQIAEVARAQAQQEAQKIIEERKIRAQQEKDDIQAAKDRDVYEQARTKELRKLTTTRSERFVEGAQKVGEKLQAASQKVKDKNIGEKLQAVSRKFEQQKVKASVQGSQLGRDIGSTFQQSRQLGNIVQQSNVVSPKRKGVADLLEEVSQQSTPTRSKKKGVASLVAQNNYNTPIEKKIFGNTFTQGKSTVGGFSNEQKIKQLTGINKDNVKRFFKF